MNSLSIHSVVHHSMINSIKLFKLNHALFEIYKCQMYFFRFFLTSKSFEITNTFGMYHYKSCDRMVM